MKLEKTQVLKEGIGDLSKVSINLDNVRVSINDMDAWDIWDVLEENSLIGDVVTDWEDEGFDLSEIKNGFVIPLSTKQFYKTIDELVDGVIKALSNLGVNNVSKEDVKNHIQELWDDFYVVTLQDEYEEVLDELEDKVEDFDTLRQLERALYKAYSIDEMEDILTKAKALDTFNKPDGFEWFEGHLNDSSQPLGVGAEVITKDGRHYWITFVDDWDDKYAWGSPNKSDIETEQGYSIDKDDIRFVKPHAYNESLKEDYISGENGLDMWQDDYMINADSYSKEYRDNFLKIQKLKKEIKAAFNNCKTVKEANDCYEESVEKVWNLAEEIYKAFGGRGKTPVGISDTLDYFEDAIGDFEDKALTRIERETPKDESLKEGKKMNNKLTEAVDKNALVKFIGDALKDLKSSDAYHTAVPVWYFDMSSPNGLHLVIGYDSADNYDSDDLERFALDKSGEFVVNAKLAVNVDDLQSDFDWDWYMPFDRKTGEVWDTEMAITKYETPEGIAKEYLDEFEKMKDLNLDEDGAILEEPMDEACKKEEKCDGKDCDDDKCDKKDDKKPLKESSDQDDIHTTVYDVLHDHAPKGQVRDEMYDLMLNLTDRALSWLDDGSDIDGAVQQAIDDGMIYTDDMWTAYRHYCDIGDGEDAMWEGLYNDLGSILYICTTDKPDLDDVDYEDDDEGAEDPMNEDELWESLNKLDDQPVADDVLDEAEDKRTIGDVLDVELEDGDNCGIKPIK